MIVNKKSGFLFLLGGIGLLLLANCSESQQKKAPQTHLATRPSAVSGEVQKNRSEAVATVLEVLPGEAKGFSLRVLIDSVKSLPGFGNFARPKDTLEIQPKFRIREGQQGQINPEDSINRVLLNARELKGGEKIKVELELSGSPGQHRWWFYHWEKFTENK